VIENEGTFGFDANINGGVAANECPVHDRSSELTLASS
jgi:hypothetical protein